MLKYVALSAMLALPNPNFAEEHQVESCHIVGSEITGHDLYLDLIRDDLCMVHAKGYVRGVVNTGDELYFSLPAEGLSYQDVYVIYRIWVMKNLEKAQKHSPAVCLVVSLAQLFPMPEKEVEDAQPE
ncbi:MAG: hypothetical protein ACXAEN_26285 [Candidatus Thorarchaeota archaeon]